MTAATRRQRPAFTRPGFVDPESGIAKYYYSIGTAAGGTSVVDWD